MAAVFRNERVALLYRDRLQPHRIAGQMLSEGNELTAQHRDDENKKRTTVRTKTVRMRSDAPRRLNPNL